MSLQAIAVPNGDNQVFTAFVLGLLLPLLEDDTYEEKCEQLFGRINRKIRRQLDNDLANYSHQVFPESLDGLITSHLRPRLADYLTSHQADYQRRYKKNQAALSAAIEAIRSNSPLFVDLVLDGLAEMMKIDIQIHHDLQGSDVVQQHTPQHGFNTTIHLTLLDDAYLYLVDPMTLPEDMRSHLFPHLSAHRISDPAVYRIERLKELLHEVISDIPSHLTNFSTKVPQKPMERGLSSTRPTTEDKHVMRFDSVRESHVVRNDLKNTVRMNRVYDLALWDARDGDYLPHRLYIKFNAQARGFNYIVRRPNNEITPQDGCFISFAELGITGITPTTIQDLNAYLSKILTITHARGDTQDLVVERGTMTEWVQTELTGAAVGSVSGLATLGAIVAFGEFEIAAGAGFALIPGMALPIAAGILLTTLVTTTIGKSYALHYEEAINKASEKLSAGQYNEAADYLDTEFGRWDIVKLIRSVHLENAHYAIAHFFRALCAEKLGRKDLAYKHYTISAEKLSQDAKKSMTYLVSQLQRLNLLKNAMPEELDLPDNHDISEEIKTILSKISVEYADGFANTYWDIHADMSTLATRLINPHLVDVYDIQKANQFLISDCFFAVQHFADGYGEFLSLFGSFFRGAILTSYFLYGWSYLDEQVRGELLNGLMYDTSWASRPDQFAFMKFLECTLQLQRFERDHAELIVNNPSIQASIELIKNFILNFHILVFSDRAVSDLHANLPQLLAITNQDLCIRRSKINDGLLLIAKINGDFNLSYTTISSLVAAIEANPSALFTLCSATGDTLLHVLSLLPEQQIDIQRMQRSAGHFKSLRHLSNKSEETPLDLLQVSDPYRLKAALFPQASLGTCGLILRSHFNEGEVRRLLEEYNAVYIRVQARGVNEVYYMYQTLDSKTSIALDDGQLAQFDQALQPTDRPRVLSEQELVLIHQQFGHSHEYSVWAFYIEEDKLDYADKMVTRRLNQFDAEDDAVRVPADPLTQKTPITHTKSTMASSTYKLFSGLFRTQKNNQKSSDAPAVDVSQQRRGFGNTG
ncbi:MAG: hypothetical protein CK424_06365 [Legionella sp.]|nr:MAG: hypothetical protein CK424_06365 [Legionella sp.]